MHCYIMRHLMELIGNLLLVLCLGWESLSEDSCLWALLCLIRYSRLIHKWSWSMVLSTLKWKKNTVIKKKALTAFILFINVNRNYITTFSSYSLNDFHILCANFNLCLFNKTCSLSINALNAPIMTSFFVSGHLHKNYKSKKCIT